MNWKKGCLIAIGVAVVLAVLIVALVFWLTSGPVEAAGVFLGLVGEGDLSAAYRATAPAFQAQQDEATFGRIVGQLGLTDYASASWTNRSIQGGQADLEGTFTTRAGDRIPLTMSLVKVGDEWKVFSLSGERAGAEIVGRQAPEPAAQPPLEDLPGLATESVLALNRSIVERDFSSFHAYTSRLWQAQTTPEELAAAFQPFVDNEIDMAGIADVEPLFERDPAVDSDGVLELEGHFPTTPLKVVFALRYVPEDSRWKLLGIHVNLVE